MGEAELEVLELKERRITRIELRGVAIVSEGESENEVPRHE